MIEVQRGGDCSTEKKSTYSGPDKKPGNRNCVKKLFGHSKFSDFADDAQTPLLEAEAGDRRMLYYDRAEEELENARQKQDRERIEKGSSTRLRDGSLSRKCCCWIF